MTCQMTDVAITNWGSSTSRNMNQDGQVCCGLGFRLSQQQSSNQGIYSCAFMHTPNFVDFNDWKQIYKELAEQKRNLHSYLNTENEF